MFMMFKFQKNKKRNIMNKLGVKTLYIKETNRFLKVYNQTLLAPVINALLFLAVFNLALGHHVDAVAGVPFSHFMSAGLIIMSAMQNAFANSSSSFIMGKVLGTMIDYMMPPLSPFEIVLSMTAASITRGLVVGILVAIAVTPFTDMEIYNIFIALFYLISASMLLGLLGLLAGILAETFDQMAAITSYLITPLAFLSGTFYSVHNLPEIWYKISQFNPFFYMIDGFRFGITGHHDGNMIVGVIIIIFANSILWLAVQKMIKSGYRIKS